MIDKTDGYESFINSRSGRTADKLLPYEQSSACVIQTCDCSLPARYCFRETLQLFQSMNEQFTCPGCHAELNPGESVCIHCGQPIKPKLNWWVDIGLLMAGPCLFILMGLLDGAFNFPGGLIRLVFYLPPIPLGLVLGYRVATRSVFNKGISALITILLGGVFAGLIFCLSVLGCALLFSIS